MAKINSLALRSKEIALAGLAEGVKAVEADLETLSPTFLIPQINPREAGISLLASGIQAKESGMGFFKTAFKVIGSIGRSLLGLPAKAATAVRAAPRAAAVGAGVLAAGGLTAGALALGGGGAPGGAPGFVVNPATGELVAPGGGNGVLATTTMVTTVNRLTGQIVKQRVFVGSPFIMNKEVAHLKSTIKKLRRGAGKIPTTTRAPSLNAQITAAIKDAMLHQAQRGAATVLATGHQTG